MNAYAVKHAREWLLPSHVPQLLSYRVTEDQNLLDFALPTGKLATLSNQDRLASAAAQLYADLLLLVDVFKQHSKEVDDQTKSYDVCGIDIMMMQCGSKTCGCGGGVT